MKITLSVDEKLAELARGLAGQRTPEARASAIVALFVDHPGDSGGRKLVREDAYEGRL